MGDNVFNQIIDKYYVSERDVFADFLELVVEKTGSQVGYLHLYDESTHSISLNTWSGEVISQCTAVHDNHYSLDEAGVWADCIRQRRPVTHNDYAGISSSSGLPQGHFPVANHFSFPVFRGRDIVAVIGVGNRSGGYSQGLVDTIQSWTQIQWPALTEKITHIHELQVRMESDFDKCSAVQVMVNMVSAMSKALEIRDEYTSYHQKNVAFISELIGKKLGFSPNRLLGLYTGALIHDIGKIAIPSQILNKPGKLTSAEVAMLQSHCECGASVFQDVDLPWPILGMIVQHHERQDGSGYPNQLQGREICLEARIIAVADTYDAMASDRPYRKSLGSEKAIEEILSGRITKYDPYVVDAFMACIEEDPTFSSRYRPPKIESEPAPILK